jgi:hypothetical protein
MKHTAVKKLLNGLTIAIMLFVGVSHTTAGVCTSDDVYVGDIKVFPGTLCRQIGTTSTVQYDSNGRILNSSTTSAVTVICPIVRDASVDKWDGINIVVADRNPNTDITCQARSNQTDGLGWAYPNPAVKTTGAKFDWWSSDTLSIGSPVEERDLGTFFVTCTIPPRYQSYEPSGVYSYRISECAHKTSPY